MPEPVTAELIAGATPPVRPHELRRLARLLHDRCGIRLRPGKEALIRSRLARRLAAVGARSFDRYLDIVERGDGAELRALIDALTTNKTGFFREAPHFDYLRSRLAPALAGGTRALRLWSAGCSTGEEPFTIAMVLRDALPPARYATTRILATDISTRALAAARAAAYDARAVADVPPPFRRTAFVRRGESESYRVRAELRAAVRFARLNLVDRWPMRGPFDAIFCRNVMIYFDQHARQRVVERFIELLAPGGHLFVGHSESLGVLARGLRYVQPAVYAR